MGTKTEHYQLNQWEPGDSFLRTDFNEDNAKIDAAIATKTEAVFGIYQGTGEYEQYVDLGFPPKAVLLETNNGFRGDNQYSGGLVLPGQPLATNVAKIDGNGFWLRKCYSGVNLSSGTVYYIAFK